MHKIDLINRLKKSEPQNEPDDYFRQTEDLPTIDPLVANKEVELFDAKKAFSRISTEVDILERQICQPGMYPILQSPVPTSSGFVPHRPNSTFKSINPATPSAATGSSQQVSFKSLLDMVNSTQNGNPSSGSSIPCAQRSLANKQNSPALTQQDTLAHSQSTQSQQVPNQQSATGQQEFASLLANTQPQNVAPLQPSAPAPQPFQQSPVVHQQQQLLLQPPVPGSHAAHQQQGQPQFLQHRVSPQAAKATIHHLDKDLILLCSLVFLLQRHNKIQCPTPRSQAISKWTVLSNPTAPDVELEVTSQQSVL